MRHIHITEPQALIDTWLVKIEKGYHYQERDALDLCVQWCIWILTNLSITV
jgi:hypothetical protein